MNENTGTIEPQMIKDIIRRQKSVFLLAFIIIFSAAAIIAFVLPPIYRSQSHILIEEQQIPEEYVNTADTSYVEERLQLISQQIMSRPQLLEIIKNFNLYANMRDQYTTEEIVDKFRERFNLETISADVIDRRTNRPSSATIAFTLSFDDEKPEIAQKVANRLTSLYLEENLRTREARATNITSFLQQELDNLKSQINELEDKISRFKQQHEYELPEFNAINLQAVSRLQRDIDQAEMDIRSLNERKIYLEGQLAGIDPQGALLSEEGKKIMNPKERLKFLRLQLVTLQSQLSAKHPDVKKLRREIAELETQVGDIDDSLDKAKRLEELQGRLVTLKGRLGTKHPDVIKLAKEVEILAAELKRLPPTAGKLAETNPENPAYINIRTQIASTSMEIKSRRREIEQLKREIAKYQQRIENVPRVERDFTQMSRDYDNAKYKYNEIMNKLMEARVAQGMEESRKGERFTIIDPAQLPERPIKPNRLAIVLIGFVLALGAGVGLGAVRENLNDTIKTEEELGRLTGLPVFTSIPLMESDKERRQKRNKKILIIVLLVAAIAVALLLFHLFVMPLDILLLKLQRKLARL
ncbi:MAG: lipopolysaccharide biosynthesis protein [Deltaproteobacteria bacterium]|nr:MAG: lipopolysaccharide biosynthesis protein [Deltaproteobacteria bacterium]